MLESGDVPLSSDMRRERPLSMRLDAWKFLENAMTTGEPCTGRRAEHQVSRHLDMSDNYSVSNSKCMYRLGLVLQLV